MKFDIHVHSMYSHDSIEKPTNIIKKAKRIGLDGIVITEHNSFEVSAPWEEYKDTNLVILRGAEYKTREGHVLIYGINSDQHIPEKGKELSELIEISNKEGWALVAPHPFKSYGSGDDNLKETLQTHYSAFSAVEVNSRCSEEDNIKAIKFAREMGLPLVGGSDAHFASRVGRTHTEFSVEIKTIQDLVQAIKESYCTYHAIEQSPQN